MENLFKTIHNVQTGEIQEVPLTAEDLAVKAADEAEVEIKKAKQIQAEADKAALLAKLGITADEAKLLLS